MSQILRFSEKQQGFDSNTKEAYYSPDWKIYGECNIKEDAYAHWFVHYRLAERKMTFAQVQTEWNDFYARKINYTYAWGKHYVDVQSVLDFIRAVDKRKDVRKGERLKIDFDRSLFMLERRWYSELYNPFFMNRNVKIQGSIEHNLDLMLCNSFFLIDAYHKCFFDFVDLQPGALIERHGKQFVFGTPL